MYPLSFEEYGLSPELLSGLADVRFEKPTPLQTEVLPPALQGKHMLVKTEAGEYGTFLIPAMQQLAGSGNGEVFGTQVLILTPSIERAKELDELVWAMGYHAQISSALIAMKGDKQEQEKAVLDGAPVVIANPGRLIEILEKNSFQLPNLKMIVIDEAHNMENFNLVNRVKDIMRFVVGEPQVLITTGSHNKATKTLAELTLKDPQTIGFNGEMKQKASESPEATSDVDIEEVKEKLEDAKVEVVLNPASDESSDTEEAVENTSNDEPADDAIAEIQEKLEEAEVEVVLNPEAKEESAEEEPQNEEEISASEQEDPKEHESRETTSDDEEITAADIDIEEVEQKLEKASIKVVLKKDIVEQTEEQEKDDVEPVLANPILQGEADLPDPVAKELEQGYINVPPRMKISTLMAHLEESKAKKVMVFAASKRTTDRLFRIIRKKNWGVVSISESLDEDTYKERFARFTSGEMRVLLVGGLKANQVEIERVEEVINYDVPDDVDEYRYRAELVGNKKAARIISLVSKMDRDDIDRISKEVGFPPTELPLPVEVKDKKQSKSKSGKNDNRKKQSRNNNNRNNNRRNSSRNNRNDRSGRKNAKRKKPKELELPRPTYDGLSGGREGNNGEKSTGVIGWVKKLFS